MAKTKSTFTTQKRRDYSFNWDGKIPLSLQIDVYQEEFEKRPKKMGGRKRVYSTLIETKTFDFVSITEPELVDRRKENLPTMVVKVEDAIYITSIPKTVNLLGQKILSDFSIHLCSSCTRMSAKREEEGGCKKVIDRDFLMALKWYSSMKKVLAFSKRVEAYPFIKKGLEVFGTYNNFSESSTDVFIVSICKNYEVDCPQKKSRY